MQPTVSIIVPVYNAESTLRRCVEITPELYRNRPWPMKLGQSLLRVFAPLM